MQRLHFIYNKNTAIFYVSHFSSLFLNNNLIFFSIANLWTEEQNIKSIFSLWAKRPAQQFASNISILIITTTSRGCNAASVISLFCKNILLLLRTQMSARIANCIDSHFPVEQENGRLFFEIPQSLSERHSCSGNWGTSTENSIFLLQIVVFNQ